MTDESKWEEILLKMEGHVREHRCHLKPRYSVIDLSLETSLPQYIISKAINKTLGVSYSVWMNRMRIEHFLDLIKSEGTSEYGLYVFALRSGFHSKATFINAFKKELGVTPGVYVKTMNAREKDGGPAT